MLGVKITILCVVLTIIAIIVVRSYLEDNRARAREISLLGKYPIWLEILSWVIVFDMIGIIYSVVYILFWSGI